MDKETKTILNRITGKIPARLARNITKVEYDTTQEEKAIVALNSKHISKDKKARLSRLLDKGAFRRRQEVLDEDKIKELDKYHTREIAKAKREGRLKDPMTDPFYRARMKRLDRIQKGLEKPTQQKPYTADELAKARKALDPTINPKNHERK